jgi:hypothetical protein
MTATLEDLARRVAAMEDIAAVTALKVRYLRACDRKQPDIVRDCFVQDAVIDFEGFPVFTHRDDFVDLYARFGCVPNVLDMHHMQNPVVTLTGPDTAEGLFDLYFFQIDKQARTMIQLASSYEDRFVRRDGRWLFSHSKSRRLSFLMQEVDADGLAKVVGLGEQTQTAFGQAAPAEA